MFFQRNQKLLQCFLINQQFRYNLSTKSFYDVLQITPKATKNDIKKAYYRLSLIYHPDQNQGNENAAIKFREITEAYEVLGDVTRRRLYDKGFYGFPGAMSSDSTGDPEVYSKFYRPSRKAPSVGRTQIYDFDAWSRVHYSDAFERKQREKKQREMNRSFEQEKIKFDDERKTARFLFGLFSLFSVIGIANFVTGDYDIDHVRKSEKKDR